jgi:hypothetical protein
MSSPRFRIHISDFCHRLYQQAQSQEKRLEKDPDDVYEGFDDKPRAIDAVADFIARRAGLKLDEVHAYIHRAGHGASWGRDWRGDRRKGKPKLDEMWPDISGIAQKMSAFSNTPDMDELLVRFLDEYPHEAAEMDLPLIYDALRDAVGPKERVPDIEGYRTADWLWHEHGIKHSRLSEAARDGNVKTTQAPRGTLDSQGRKVRTLYNEAEAVKHCSPKRVTGKRRRKVGLDNS